VISFVAGIFDAQPASLPIPPPAAPTPAPHIPDVSSGDGISPQSSQASPATTITKTVYLATASPAVAVSGVAQAQLTDRLAVLEARLSAKIANAMSYSDTSTRTIGRSFANLAVSGVSGLVDADIPDGITASNYLPLAGGTITGNLAVSGAFSGGALSLANASTTLLSVLGPAYFGATATSTFAADGSLTLASALTSTNGGTGVSSFGQGWLFSNGGTGALAASTSPTVNYLTATSTSATSTFRGNLAVTGTASIPTLSVTGNKTYSGASSAANSFMFMPGSALFGTASPAPNGIISPFNIYISGDVVDTTTSALTQTIDS
jgi:hypothetical protein